MSLRLLLGNRCYSTWSMRVGLIVRAFDLPVIEEVYPHGEASREILKSETSPTGLVPVLADGETIIWDSIAIAETLAERFAEKPLWPTDRTQRALARSVTAEMHSGFLGPRNKMPMHLGRIYPFRDRGVGDEIDRMQQLWAGCLEASGGPYLFGDFCIADAFHAPLVARMRTYSVPLETACEAYAKVIETHPAYISWRNDGLAEPWDIPAYNFDEPHEDLRAVPQQ